MHVAGTHMHGHRLHGCIELDSSIILIHVHNWDGMGPSKLNIDLNR